MENNIMLKIAEHAMDIGASSKHFVTADLSKHYGTFPVVVYIHKYDRFGMSDGIEDSLSFSTDDSYEFHKEWLQKWAERIAMERKADGTT